MTTAFKRNQFGKPRPNWVKKKHGTAKQLAKLADFICTRTPPKSFGSIEALFECIIKQNKQALRNWTGGYNILTDMVRDKLLERDGEL